MRRIAAIAPNLAAVSAVLVFVVLPTLTELIEGVTR